MGFQGLRASTKSVKLKDPKHPNVVKWVSNVLQMRNMFWVHITLKFEICQSARVSGFDKLTREKRFLVVEPSKISPHRQTDSMILP